LLSGEKREIWLAGINKPACPFAMTADECFMFFAADADVGIFLACDWPVPRHVIDLRVEFMRIRNGLAPLPPLEGGDPDIAAEKEAKAGKKRRKKPGKFSLSKDRAPLPSVVYFRGERRVSRSRHAPGKRIQQL
jgi:hypothetical protein